MTVLSEGVAVGPCAPGMVRQERQGARDSWHSYAHRRLTGVFEGAVEVPFDHSSRFVFLSDCHRGNGSRADAFARCFFTPFYCDAGLLRLADRRGWLDFTVMGGKPRLQTTGPPHRPARPPLPGRPAVRRRGRGQDSVRRATDRPADHRPGVERLSASPRRLRLRQQPPPTTMSQMAAGHLVDGRLNFQGECLVQRRQAWQTRTSDVHRRFRPPQQVAAQELLADDRLVPRRELPDGLSW
jgi:hypothetical protein